MQKAKLMFWQIEKISDTERRLSGLVFGHPNFRNGEVVTTSPVEKIEEHIATTRNTIYELGDLGTHNRMLFEVRALNDELNCLREEAKRPPSITLTAEELRDALEFVNPDGPDNNEQLMDGITIEWRDPWTSDEGEFMGAGYYAHMTDYPEEGVYGPLGQKQH